ncbi:MAG: hypothetical protein Q4G50_07520 [Corynebacterium sp.]|uniref:hypothetical protein n=1 Tax=Corynebacterium sp. TaxID=1720 RepID=UPI0026E06206|nr:hypothetical protein [Corynebacterium sp.]MDO5669837.1 hypothetical protein [Corynebacterium sp.]
MPRHALKKLRSELSISVTPPQAREALAVELRKTLEMMSSTDVEWIGLIEGTGSGELVIHLRASGASFGEAQDALDEFVNEMIRRMASSGEHFEQGSNLLLPA